MCQGASSVVEREREFYKLKANDWWMDKGPYEGLHAMNAVRVPFLVEQLCKLTGKPASGEQPLEGLRVLDVGCGGGILAEAVAKQGAHVVGIDIVEEGLHVAREHAMLTPGLAERLTYKCISAEELVQASSQFDAVIASEVIEHVANPRGFCATLTSLAKPSGGVLITTFNRTAQSLWKGIMLAEYVYGVIPRGTHEWQKFVKPQELTEMMGELGLQLQGSTGSFFNLSDVSFKLDEDMSVTYMAFYSKARSS